MKISSISVTNFRRFTSLKIEEIPETAKLVVLVGPNGGGKSALFDAINLWHRRSTNMGFSSDGLYYEKGALPGPGRSDRYNQMPVSVSIHGDVQITDPERFKSLFHIRTAYRHDADFTLQNLQSIGNIPRDHSINRLIDIDTAVAQNYHRLVSESINVFYGDSSRPLNVGQLQDDMIGGLRASFSRVFPETSLATLGRPLVDGTFYFSKGSVKQFHYKNLSGGEKSVFDLLLDLYMRSKMDPETIYLIDEPELHTNAVIQRQMLEEMVHLVPVNGQLWIATHSFGMLNAASKMLAHAPGSVVFLNFWDRDFDAQVSMKPETPGRVLWQRVLRDSLDDLADLVAPGRVVLCEGNPSNGFDAACYNQIFASEFPDTLFISMGSSSQLENGGVSISNLILDIARGTEVLTLLDRDDMSAHEELRLGNDTRVLSRRELENYLLDDEVLEHYCQAQGKADLASEVLAMSRSAIEDVRSRPDAAPDEMKDASGAIYNGLKRILGLTNAGRNASIFLREQLAPIVTPGMRTYEELRESIFGAPSGSRPVSQSRSLRVSPCTSSIL